MLQPITEKRRTLSDATPPAKLTNRLIRLALRLRHHPGQLNAEPSKDGAIDGTPFETALEEWI